MRILVIGGTSFIGPAVVTRLSEQGHNIMLFHRGQTEAELPPDVRHIHSGEGRLPIQFSADVVNGFQRLAPDVVLHMMILGEQDARETINIFRDVARRVVMISSQVVYRAFGRVNRQESGPPEALPLAEDSPLRERFYLYRGETPRAPDDPAHWMDNYDKIPAERIVMNDLGIVGTVLRLPMVYGPTAAFVKTA